MSESVEECMKRDGRTLDASVEFRAKAIAALRERFSAIIVTVGELFDVQEFIEDKPESPLRSFQRYRMLPFGYALRAKLIKKWFELNARDGTVSDETLLSQCDQAEKLINFAMIRNVVPSLPLYLLSLLQSVSAGVSGQFQETSLGASCDDLGRRY